MGKPDLVFLQESRRADNCFSTCDSRQQIWILSDSGYWDSCSGDRSVGLGLKKEALEAQLPTTTTTDRGGRFLGSLVTRGGDFTSKLGALEFVV